MIVYVANILWSKYSFIIHGGNVWVRGTNEMQKNIVPPQLFLIWSLL